MSTRKPVDSNVKAAWIAAVGVILAAVIGGVFGLIKLSTATQPTPTPQVTPAVDIGGSYSGTMQNTTSNVSGSMTLVIQQNQGSIGGNLTVSPPAPTGGTVLVPGSGPIISGSTNTDSAGKVSLQFTVQFTVQSGYTAACGEVCTFDFQGVQNPDKSLQGSYRIEQDGETGTWVVSK